MTQGQRNLSPVTVADVLEILQVIARVRPTSWRFIVRPCSSSRCTSSKKISCESMTSSTSPLVTTLQLLRQDAGLGGRTGSKMTAYFFPVLSDLVVVVEQPCVLLLCYTQSGSSRPTIDTKTPAFSQGDERGKMSYAHLALELLGAGLFCNRIL